MLEIFTIFTAFITAIALDRSHPQVLRINFYSSASFRLTNAAGYIAQYFSVFNSWPRKGFYSFLYYSLFFFTLMIFYMLFFRETYDLIVSQLLNNTTVFLFFSFCFYLICIISFSQTSIFLNLLYTSQNYLSTFYILLSDLLLSIVLFVILSSAIFTLALELLPRGKPFVSPAKAIEICYQKNTCLTQIFPSNQMPKLSIKPDELYIFAHATSTLEGKFANLDHLPSLQFTEINLSDDELNLSELIDNAKFLKNAEIKFYDASIRISGYLPISTFKKFSIFFNRNINGVTELIRSGFTYFPPQYPLLEKLDYQSNYLLNKMKRMDDDIIEVETITDRELIHSYQNNWEKASFYGMQKLDSSQEGFFVKSLTEHVSFASARELVKALIQENNKRNYYDLAQSTSLWPAIFPNDKIKMSKENLKVTMIIYFVTAISLSFLTLLVFTFLTLAKLMSRAASYVSPKNKNTIPRKIATYPITFVLSALLVLEISWFFLTKT